MPGLTRAERTFIWEKLRGRKRLNPQMWSMLGQYDRLTKKQKKNLHHWMRDCLLVRLEKL